MDKIQIDSVKASQKMIFIRQEFLYLWYIFTKDFSRVCVWVTDSLGLKPESNNLHNMNNIGFTHCPCLGAESWSTIVFSLLDGV